MKSKSESDLNTLTKNSKQEQAMSLAKWLAALHTCYRLTYSTFLHWALVSPLEVKEMKE